MSGEDNNAYEITIQRHKNEIDQLLERQKLEEDEFQAAKEHMQERHELETKQLRASQQAELNNLTVATEPTEPAGPLKKVQEKYTEIAKKDAVGGYSIEDLIKAPAKPPAPH